MRTFEVRRRGEDIVFCSEGDLRPPGMETMCVVAGVTPLQTAFANTPFGQELAALVARRALTGDRNRCLQAAGCMVFNDEFRELLEKIAEAALRARQ